MRTALMKVVKLRQQMQQGKAQQKRASKSVEHLDMLRFIQLETEDRHRAKDDARKQDQVIHHLVTDSSIRIVNLANCKRFAIPKDEKAATFGCG